jgi:cytosine/adenosine deaminase-related metal-dependent hydrolase
MQDEGSRRHFLKSSAALIGGSAATEILAGNAAAQAPATDAAELARLQRARRVLLKGGIVLTLDRAIGDFAQGDVLIEDGKIRDVRANIAAADAFVVDTANRIVIPGFIDTHCHSYQGLLRSLLPNGIVEPDYDRDIQNNLTPVYRPEEVYAGVLATALGMVDTGTTCMVDISQISHTPEHSDAGIRALQESGIRAVFAYSRGSGPASQYPQDLPRIRRTYFNSENQLLTLALGASTDPKIFAYAREQGVRAVLHIRVNSEPLLDLARAGLLRPGDELIHCTHLNEEAWRVIHDSGARISLCPALEMAMGHGVPAIQTALDRGIRPSLSSDHAATVAQDFFSVMRATFNVQRLFVLQRVRNGEQNVPPLLNPREVLEFATIEGARCANLDSKVGTLTPGKDADILLLAADRLNVWPLNNAYGLAVNLMNPSHVESVFIAGKAKKWRGNLVGVDTPRVRRLITDAHDALLRRTGFRINLVG